MPAVPVKIARPPAIQLDATVPLTFDQLVAVSVQVPSPPVMMPLPAVPAPFHHWVETPSTMAMRLTCPATEVWITLEVREAGTPERVRPAPARLSVPV